MEAQQDFLSPTQEEWDKMMGEALRLQREAMRQLAEAHELIKSLLEKRRKLGRFGKDLDKYGEPTWRFAIKVKIPMDLRLTRVFTEYARAQGIDDVQDQFEGFVNWYRKSGKKWMDWTRVWFDWCRNEKKKRMAAATSMAPRLKTSRTLPEL